MLIVLRPSPLPVGIAEYTWFLLTNGQIRGMTLLLQIGSPNPKEARNQS